MNKTLSWIAFDLGAAQVDMSTMSLVERGIYVSLLTRCGVKGFLETDVEVLRRACGATKQHVPMIERVLGDFFILSNGCWLHKMVLESEHSRSSRKGLPISSMKSMVGTYTDRQTEREDKQAVRQADSETGREDTQTDRPVERLTSEALRKRNSMFA